MNKYLKETENKIKSDLKAVATLIAVAVIIYWTVS